MNLVAIAYNEGLYIKEWVEFHKARGFERIYVYDNGSTDDTADILDKIEDVIRIPWPRRPGQLPAYRDFIVNHSESDVLTAFIDIDEFIVGDIPTDADAVMLNWYLFGSSNEKFYREDFVVNRFRFRQGKVNPHVKSLIRPNKFLGPILDPHYIPVSGKVVDGNGEVIETPSPFHTPKEPLACRIHHYVTKSLQECYIKCSRHRADTGAIRDFQKYFTGHDYNEVLDETAILDNLVR